MAAGYVHIGFGFGIIGGGGAGSAGAVRSGLIVSWNDRDLEPWTATETCTVAGLPRPNVSIWVAVAPDVQGCEPGQDGGGRRLVAVRPRRAPRV